MADPLSATASIIAVIQISGTVLSTCYQYIASVKDAPRDIQWVIKEVINLKVILEDIRGLVSTAGDHCALSKSLNADNGPLKTCESALKVLSDKLDPVVNVRRSLSRLVWPLKEKRVQQVLNILQKQKRNLMLALHADEARAITSIEKSLYDNASQVSQILVFLAENTDVARSVKDTIKQIEVTTKRETVMKWLHTTSPSQNHVAAWEEHEPDTGDYLLSSVDYRRWKDASGQLAWLNGISGCGKTVLSAAVIEDMKAYCSTRPDCQYVYYYFDFSDTAKRKPTSMIQSLAAQIVAVVDDVPMEILELFAECDKGLRQPTLKAILPVLISLIRQQNHIYVILDALDESSERAQLLDLVNKLHHSCTNIHFFLVSRGQHDISTNLLPIVSHNFQFGGKAVTADIRLYVHNHLSTNTSLDKWPTTVKTEIEEALVQGSEGMFRWAFCQLNSLKQCHTLRTLRHSLQNLPRGLYETYDRMLSEIPETHQLEAEKALLWLAFAERPLKLAEVAEAVIIDNENKSFNIEDRLFEIHDILSICSSFVSLVASEEGYNEGGKNLDNEWRRTLQLSHYSVKEYIVSQHDGQRNYPIVGLSDSGAHRYMAEICLIYVLAFFDAESHGKTIGNTGGRLMNLNEESTDRYRLYKKWPFVSYAADEWYCHYQKIAPAEDEDVTELMMSLFDTNGGNAEYIIWYKVWECTHYPAYHELGCEPLVFASREGVSKAVHALLDRGKEPRESLNRALIMACTKGRSDIVEALLVAGDEISYRLDHGMHCTRTKENGLMLNICLIKNHTAIEAAATFNHPDVVCLLLIAGADANTRSSGLLRFEGTLLHETCLHGHTEMVRVLIEGGAEVCARGVFAGHEKIYTPLDIVVHHGYKSIVTLLLSQVVSYGPGITSSSLHKARLDCLHGTMSTWNKMSMMHALGSCMDFEMTTTRYSIRSSVGLDGESYQDYFVFEEAAELRLLKEMRTLEEELVANEAEELLERLKRLWSS